MTLGTGYHSFRSRLGQIRSNNVGKGHYEKTRRPPITAAAGWSPAGPEAGPGARAETHLSPSSWNTITLTRTARYEAVRLPRQPWGCPNVRTWPDGFVCPLRFQVRPPAHRLPVPSISSRESSPVDYTVPQYMGLVKVILVYGNVRFIAPASCSMLPVSASILWPASLHLLNTITTGAPRSPEHITPTTLAVILCAS